MSSGGRFISFEGIDGCGKSTQVAALAGLLTASECDVVRTREPGGSSGAEVIRKLLVEGDPDRWSAETEILLFTAARRDHVEHVIRPALDRGAFVLCDRFVNSTRVYQGTVRSELRSMVDSLHDIMIGIEPDLTVILDVDPGEASCRDERRGSGEDRYEKFGLGFQERLREGFLALALEFPDRCRVISGDGDPDAVSRRICDSLELGHV